MFEENDATNAGGNDVALPTNAPAAPPVPTSPAPAAPTAPAKVSSPMGASQEQPAPPLPVSPAAPSRSFMGALAHALIGSTMAVAAKGVKAVAGPPAPDANGKVTPNYSVDNTRSRLERLAQHALEGLAAGSQIGPQKSKAAAWGAGIGAGAKAELGQAQQQDLLKRQQAAEDYETQQKTILHKATVAMTNAQTHATWQKFADDENAKDIERQQNTGIVNSLNDFIAQNPTSKLTVQTLTEEQAMAMRETDSHTVAKHTFLPMGKTQAKDANGNDVYEADGQTPKFVKQFAAIGGSADEKVPLPQGMADDVKKYAKYDPRLKSFAQVQAGTMVPFTGFLTAYKYATEDKGREADGWREAKPGDNAVSVNGKTVKRNNFTGDTQEYAGTPLAAKKEEADIAEKQSIEKKNLAEAKKADQADNKPVYAYNAQSKQLEQTTRSTVAANPTLYTNPVDVKESDIRKDTELARQLGDAQLNLSRYRSAAQKLDTLSLGEQRAVAALVGEDKFKAEFMGAQVPTDWLNKLLTSENWRMLPKTAQDAVIGYIGARGAVIAYQKAVSGSGRANKEQLELELQNIPNPLLPKDVREAQFDRFQQNIDQTGAGLPKMVGIERPKEIQQRIEAEEAQKQGATHIYDPNQKKAVPVGTWIQRHFQGMPGVKPLP